MAFCAFRTRFSTSLGSRMMSPKGMLRAWPFSVMRRETAQDQFASEWARRHSMGQLGRMQKLEGEMEGKCARTYRVHVPLSRGREMPVMDSMREVLPTLCVPTTAIWGRSERVVEWQKFPRAQPMYRCRSARCWIACRFRVELTEKYDAPSTMQAVDMIEHLSPAAGNEVVGFGETQHGASHCGSWNFV